MAALGAAQRSRSETIRRKALTVATGAGRMTARVAAIIAGAMPCAATARTSHARRRDQGTHACPCGSLAAAVAAVTTGAGRARRADGFDCKYFVYHSPARSTNGHTGSSDHFAMRCRFACAHGAHKAELCESECCIHLGPRFTTAVLRLWKTPVYAVGISRFADIAHAGRLWPTHTWTAVAAVPTATVRTVVRAVTAVIAEDGRASDSGAKMSLIASPIFQPGATRTHLQERLQVMLHKWLATNDAMSTTMVAAVPIVGIVAALHARDALNTPRGMPRALGTIVRRTRVVARPKLTPGALVTLLGPSVRIL